MTRRHFLLTTSAVAAGTVLAGCRTPPAHAGPRPIVHGVATASIHDILPFETACGRFARSYTYYRSLGATGINLDWERTNLRWLVARGTTPVLTLQPQRPGAGLTQPAYSHAAICRGDHDDLLRRWGATLAAAGGPVVVRLMHEGNGTWYPWCAGVNGGTAGSYVDAWRHVHRVVRSAGAGNVRWQWSMNKLYSSSVPTFAELYPGDDVVDEVGLSGYNGGSVVDRAGWRTFAEVFAASLDELARLTGRPRHIAETGCVEQGGDKAAWITDMWRWLGERTDVAGVTWFDFPKGAADWRVATSAASQAAYRRGAIATVPPRF